MEQGGLCGYTMRRIQQESSHIEHIKPESVCRDELKGSDLDYNNLLACYPQEGMATSYRYGAQFKDKWWENNGAEFISPLNPQCEILITFNLKGEVSAHQNHASAKKTIQVLKLDHTSLTEDRRRAIEEFIYGPSGDDPLSQNKAIQAINEIIKANKKGDFVEFCIAIRYALKEYINYLQKITQKRKHIAKTKSKK